MPYLTKDEVALLTMQPAKSEVVSPAALISNVGSAASGIIDKLLVVAAGATLDSLPPLVQNYAGNKLWLAQIGMNQNWDNFVQNIENQLTDDYQNIVTLLKAGMGQGVGSIHASLYETLTATNALLSGYNGIIQNAGINPYITRWVHRTVTPNIPDITTLFTLAMTGKINWNEFNEYTAQNGWASNWRDRLVYIMQTPTPIIMTLDLLRRGSITVDRAKEIFKLYKFTDTTQGEILSLKDNMPEPYRVADMFSKGLVDSDNMHKAFNWYGIDNTWADRFASTAYTPPSFGMLMEMYWRKLINADMFNTMITRGSAHPDVKANYIELTKSIPPANDLITMVVREAFDPTNIITAPTDFTTWMSTRGYDSTWCDRYWTAHFQPMSLTQAYDNLRRGYWDEAKFKQLMTIADIHPRWHDDILKVAYYPPTTRELGYGYDVGVYSRDDLIKYRRWGGLSADDATKAADSLIDYRLDAERNALRTLWMNMYVNGAIDEKTLRGKLKDLKTNEAAINLWVDRAALLVEAKEYDVSVTESKNLTRADIQYMFEQGLKSEKWFNETLTQIGYPEDVIKVILEQSKQRMTLTTNTASKKLSLSELTDLYYNGIIDASKLLTGLKELKYKDSDSQAIILLIEKNKPVTIKKLTITQLSKMLYANEITEEGIKAKLLDMNYSNDDANSLLNLIKANNPTLKEPVGKKLLLTETETEKLYKFGYYDEKEMMAYYEVKGFSNMDSALKTYLLMLETKIPNFVAQYRNNWISANELYESIRGINIPLKVAGIPDTKLEELIKAIIKNNKAERTIKEKDLTKAEILKGAKNNVFTPAQSVELLQGLGYDANEAQYLLAINKIISIGDPKNYWHARQAIELYKKSQGLESVDIPNELVELEEDRKAKTEQLREAKVKPNNDIEIGKLLGHVATVEGQIATIKSRLKIK